MNLSALLPSSKRAAPRLLLEADLRPIQGGRFQTTLFPDIGAAVYSSPSGTSLLVESAQSMANRLEASCWDTATQAPIEDLKGLSYVRVEKPDGSFLTSSMIEAHRLNSPYILGAFPQAKRPMAQEISEAFKEEKDPRRGIARVLMAYDAASLLHGVFLPGIDAGGAAPRATRALSAFIEADGARAVVSGGVKTDPISPSGDARAGFGMIPFQRVEYTADRMTAYFNLDLALLRGYGLAPAAERMLVLLALFKVVSLLEDGDLRLRTACDLAVEAIRVQRPAGYELPRFADVARDLRDAIGECRPMFKEPDGVIRAVYHDA